VTANLLAPRTAFDRVGPFNEKLLSGGDGEWCQRAGAEGIAVVYCPEASVGHPARASLAELMRKARRVVGGRHQRNRRSILSLDFWTTAVRFLFPNVGQFVRGRRRLQGRGYRWSAAKLAGVMALIHYVTVWEFFRVRLGGEIERR
jgi:GT2 family glycosyltransferase